MKYDISNIFCPHCDEKWKPNTLDMRYLSEDLDDLGKHVAECPKCGTHFIIREEGEGPFVSRSRKLQAPL